MSISNALSALRLVAAPLFFGAVVGEAWGFAGALFWLAVASDWADGRVARARGESSNFGGLLDHASDAVFVSSGLAALAGTGRAPVLLPWLVGLAFGQYVLDSRALVGRPLRASALGRWNGILYFVPSGVVATREALGLAMPSDELVLGLGWLLVVSTSVAMADRAWTLLASRRGAARARSASSR